jgi:hypothetical protein
VPLGLIFWPDTICLTGSSTFFILIVVWGKVDGLVRVLPYRDQYTHVCVQQALETGKTYWNLGRLEYILRYVAL